jgi:hypothetical protein
MNQYNIQHQSALTISSPTALVPYGYTMVDDVEVVQMASPIQTSV